MSTLPYSPLPIHHPARAWTSSEKTDIKKMIEEWIEQHSPIQVCIINPNRIGDDYDEVERTAYLESPGAFKP